MKKWLSVLTSKTTMKPLVNSLTWATLGSLVAVSVIAPKAEAVTIKGNFKGGVAPSNAVGGGNLMDIFQAAADWWELAIQDDLTVNIDLRWEPLEDNVLGVAITPISFPITEATIQVNNNGSINWFLDSTPKQNEEFQIFEETRENLGGGEINIGRIYTANSGNALGNVDLFTTVKHEIGHALGFNKDNPDFGDPIVLSEPLPFRGTKIPTSPEGGGHIDRPTTLLSTTFGASQRIIASEVDILGVAQVNGFEQVNLNPVHTVPEPLTVLGSVTALGLGVLLKRQHSKQQDN